MNSEDFLKQLSQDTTKHYQAQKPVLTFDAFLNLVWEHPHHPIRNANLYILDALNWIQHQQKQPSLAAVFETSSDPSTDPRVYGQADVLQKLIHAIDAAFRENVPHRLLLLHGPNGSGKTSIIRKLMAILEAYAQSSEGALYSFNWVFPNKEISGTHLGFQAASKKETLSSYAHLPVDHIDCMIRSEIHESPFFLIPKPHRADLWEKLLATVQKHWPEYASRWRYLKRYFLESTLSPRNQSIFEALFQAYEGDIQKVYRHVQVERFYLSQTTLTGLVSIHPPGHVDAGIRQVSVERNYQQLPPVLQSINLYELQGELISGNRGLIEFNDLLKRPIDSFKYLLNTCETGQVAMGPMTIQLDSVLIGTCNEKQIEAFKEYPDFSSFKARFDLIQTPFLLNYSEEAKIYQALIGQLESTKPFTPYTAQLMALWAVMTRLKKPTTQAISETLHTQVSSMSCLEKAYVYAGESENLSFELSAPQKGDELQKALHQQYHHTPHYEGSQGASPREIKNVLLCAFKRSAHQHSVTFQALALELEEFVQRTSEFEFLRTDSPEGFHLSPQAHNAQIRALAVDYADQAFRKALGLYDEVKIQAYLNKYFLHLSHHLKKEKLRNSETGHLESPDSSFLESFESRVGVEDATAFREKVMNTIASAHLSSPQIKPNWIKLFPHLYKQMIQSFHQENLPDIIAALAYLLGSSTSGVSKSLKHSADAAKQKLSTQFGYHHECLEEALGWLLKRHEKTP